MVHDTVEHPEMDPGHGEDGSGKQPPSSGVQRAYDSARTPPSIALIETIAAAAGTDPVALSVDDGVTLGDYLDPDALDTLIAGEGGSVGEITVSIDGYTAQIDEHEVVVYAPGEGSNVQSSWRGEDFDG
jgi:hypothetical protein